MHPMGFLDPNQSWSPLIDPFAGAFYNCPSSWLSPFSSISTHSSIHRLGGMDSRTSILEIEAELGFNFVSGLSREQRARDTTETLHLLEGIETINRKYSTLTFSKIRRSQKIKRDAERLFKSSGPGLWPDQADQQAPTWLLQPNRSDADDNRAPRRLYFSDLTDQEL